jgi:hypothetical protein
LAFGENLFVWCVVVFGLCMVSCGRLCPFTLHSCIRTGAELHLLFDSVS